MLLNIHSINNHFFFSISLLSNVISNDELVEKKKVWFLLSWGLLATKPPITVSYHCWKFWLFYNLELFYSKLGFESFLCNSVLLKSSHCGLTELYFIEHVTTFHSLFPDFISSPNLPASLCMCAARPLSWSVLAYVVFAPVLWNEQMNPLHWATF